MIAYQKKTLRISLLGFALLAGVCMFDVQPVAAQSGSRGSTPAVGASPESQTPAMDTAQVSRLIAPPKDWSHYQVIVQRNLFTRGSAETSRPRPTNPSGEGGRGSGQNRTRASWVLTGLVVRDDQSVAFFENSVSGMTLRITPGQSVGDLELDTIAADHVVVKTTDGPRQVFIGAAVDGRPVALSSNTGSIFGDANSIAPSSTTQSGGASGSSLTPEAEMSVVERMRARRARESGAR